MEKYSRADLVKKSASIFERLTQEVTLIACQDGQFFLDNAVSRGQLTNHCKDNDLEIYTIQRSEALINEKPAPEVKTAEKKPAKMNKAELLEYAEGKGIDVSAGKTNAEILEIIEKAELLAIDFSKMSNEELVAYAAEKEIDITACETDAAIIEVLEKTKES